MIFLTFDGLAKILVELGEFFIWLKLRQPNTEEDIEEGTKLMKQDLALLFSKFYGFSYLVVVL